LATERRHDQSVYEFVLELVETSDVFFLFRNMERI
jgi:hypothetical protein